MVNLATRPRDRWRYGVGVSRAVVRSPCSLLAAHRVELIRVYWRPFAVAFPCCRLRGHHARPSRTMLIRRVGMRDLFFAAWWWTMVTDRNGVRGSQASFGPSTKSVFTRCSAITMTCTGGRLAAFPEVEHQLSVPRDVCRSSRQRAGFWDVRLMRRDASWLNHASSSKTSHFGDDHFGLDTELTKKRLTAVGSPISLRIGRQTIRTGHWYFRR